MTIDEAMKVLRDGGAVFTYAGINKDAHGRWVSKKIDEDFATSVTLVCPSNLGVMQVPISEALSLMGVPPDNSLKYEGSMSPERAEKLMGEVAYFLGIGAKMKSDQP